MAKYLKDENEKCLITTMDCPEEKRRSIFKRFSGLDNLHDEGYKNELKKRLEAKSRANIIGLQIISAKTAPKSRPNRRTFSQLYEPELDLKIKANIYHRNLPLGIPVTIKSLNYDSNKSPHPPLVEIKSEPLKHFASPIKKTGLLETRDGSLRRSYQIVRERLVPRRTEFQPD